MPHHLRLVAVVGLALLACGCTSLIRRLATAIALQHVDRRFTVFDGRTAAFGACLRSSGGACGAGDALVAPPRPLDTELRRLRADPAAFGPGTATAAERALGHPVQRRLNALYNRLSGLPVAPVTGFASAPREDGGELVKLHFSLAEIDGFLATVSEATGAGDWDALADRAEASALADPWDRVLTAYIAAYLGAYFRGGEFVKLRFDHDADPARALKARYPLMQGSLKQLFPEYFGDGWAFGNVGSRGFVTRTGAVYQFPAVDARLDPLAGRVATGSDVELAAVAADLTRVMLEAVFDAHDRLPAASGATGLTVAAAPLPLHDPDASPVSDAEFGEVNRIANQTEAAISAALGPAIRGAGWASLNNEALARLVETFVAVTVRKVTEKAAWCWYSCDADGHRALAVAGARTEVRLVVD